MSVSAVCSFCDVGFAREREVNDLHCTSSAREVARYTDSPRPLLLISRRFPARDDVPASLPENGKRETRSRSSRFVSYRATARASFIVIALCRETGV